jgi:Tfp pilus assembly protein PilX
MSFQRQSGSALAISLVILTAITLISITSLQRSGIQTKIVANIQHQQQLFNAANSDQEHWFVQLRNSISGDNLLAQPLSAREIDADGTVTYAPVDLGIRHQYERINSNTSITYIPTQVGGIALASGQEVNDRINFRFNMDTIASARIGNKQNNQQTGVSFPGLNPGRSALF